MTTYNIEITDTYGGEPNYSWVRRATLKVPPALTKRSLVRRAKALTGWTGLRCTTYDFGDMLELRPMCATLVMFITYAEPQP
jgi:hypothetical protein